MMRPERTSIKICGLQPGDDLSFSRHPAVRYVGIVFVPRSRRYVVPESARSIVQGVGMHAGVMGVFADEPYESVVQTASDVGLQGVQLHGDESPEFCAAIQQQGLTVWKAFSAPREADRLSAFCDQMSAYSSTVDAILLDAPPPPDAVPGVSGGYGESFDWSVLPQLADALIERGGPPNLWIAGGLTASNIPRLFNHYRPLGVDVSSGVEQSGRKSRDKIDDFIEAVVRHDGTGNVS